jgi:hypothetical protein
MRTISQSWSRSKSSISTICAWPVCQKCRICVDEAAFRQAFENKAPVDGLAKRIPTRLVTREDAVLVGMAAIASTLDRYGVDYASRAWV